MSWRIGYLYLIAIFICNTYANSLLVQFINLTLETRQSLLFGLSTALN